eukprot:6047461-Amphidinium_carterae.1
MMLFAPPKDSQGWGDCGGLRSGQMQSLNSRDWCVNTCYELATSLYSSVQPSGDMLADAGTCIPGATRRASVIP